MWTVILILATGTQHAGHYSTAQACEAVALKFQQLKVAAVCVRLKKHTSVPASISLSVRS